MAERDPIERAARALCELDGNPPDAKMDGKPLWQDYVPEVRAVLSAIREPSEAMWRAADAKGSGGIGTSGEHWYAMHDALLKQA